MPAKLGGGIIGGGGGADPLPGGKTAQINEDGNVAVSTTAPEDVIYTPEEIQAALDRETSSRDACQAALDAVQANVDYWQALLDLYPHA